MKKILLILMAVLLMSVKCHAANEWREGTGANTLLGTTTVSDIDASIFQNMTDPLDRLLKNGRFGAQLKYNSVSTIDITAGNLTCSNSAGTISRFRAVTSAVTVSWADLDTGAEASGTTYYVYANCDADATTFTAKLSTSSTTPTGVTYFRRLGSFVNDGSSNITSVTNDDERFVLVTGTTTNGATISLPSGWAQDECNWTVAINSYGIYDDIGGSCGPAGVNTFSCTVNSSRVVACTSTEQGLCGISTPTANYIIACYR